MIYPPPHRIHTIITPYSQYNPLSLSAVPISYDHDPWILGVRAAREGVYQTTARTLISLQAPLDLFTPVLRISRDLSVGLVVYGCG